MDPARNSDLLSVVSRLMFSVLETARHLWVLACAVLCLASSAHGENPDKPTEANGIASDRTASPLDEEPTLAALKATGLERSRFRQEGGRNSSSAGGPTEPVNGAPRANLSQFESTIEPLLEQNCVGCHGADTAEGNIRIDMLDPDLITGPDADWWSEVLSVVTKGEMPPPDEGELSDPQRQQLVQWISEELQTASVVRRRSGTNSAFRRLTRYEYNYALQDLLGLPWDFAKDLPPESHSEDGFENSSELLHLSVTQFETYHRIARAALSRATVQGERPPTLYWGVTMQQAAEREWTKQDKKVKELEQKLKDDADKLAAELEQLRQTFAKPPRGAYYKDLISGRTAEAEWQYAGARYAFAPRTESIPFPHDYDCVAILPSGNGPKLIVELGDQLPDEGTMRVTVRASRVNTKDNYFPSLQLLFGWQASNEGRALLRVSPEDTPITATPEKPQLIQWDVPLGEVYPRNSVRKKSRMGELPSPSEYIRLVNSSPAPSAVQIDFVHVAAPVYDQWPPPSHRSIFGERDEIADEMTRARDTIAAFMTRAWRRPIADAEIEGKLELFATIRPQCHSFEEAVVEVLASVLSSPQFLYVTHASQSRPENKTDQAGRLDEYGLANRLALFLWCSIPDQELLTVADRGQLAEHDVLATQVQRMLEDPRSERFARHFVHQWLDMQLLEYMNFQQHVSGFDPLLKEAMQREPVAMFASMLKDDASVLDFIHSDYAVVNERLARHYGLPDVYGNHYRRVSLDSRYRRGGLLTQAGLLAMNSDYPDSHPLKRAVWLLESILGDPPPPPPPAVPQIDLADPRIAEMTLKERIEDHRNHAACMSCHVKIDPWGIAFENYDAMGRWRDKIEDKPVDASSELFNHQTLDGMEGLKRFLLQNRQDQFVRAFVTKLSTYALGRSLTFEDHAQIDAITAQVRRDGDGLQTTIAAIVHSELFQSQ